MYRRNHPTGVVGRYFEGSELFLTEMQKRNVAIGELDVHPGEGMLPAPMLLYMNAYIPVCDIEPRPEGEVQWGLSTDPSKPGLRHFVIDRGSNRLIEFEPMDVLFDVIKFTVLQLAGERITVEIEYIRDSSMSGISTYAEEMLKQIKQYWPEAKEQAPVARGQYRNIPEHGANSGLRSADPKGPKTLAKQQEWRKLYQRAMQHREQRLSAEQIADKLGISTRTLTNVLSWGAWDAKQRYEGDKG